MLRYEDCLGLSELTTEEISALAFHLHVPDIVAMEMGTSLCRTPEGRQLIRRLSGRPVEGARARPVRAPDAPTTPRGSDG